ncbi:hypothetical protein GCM10010531_19210 [Blastococcus jejuensis]|uniref:Nucleotide exchange factor GrpE n=1 Tax=Blastococcus jejuensis TaxID=351224 RepID=A0ABP6P452_9ACTN
MTEPSPERPVPGPPRPGPVPGQGGGPGDAATGERSSDDARFADLDQQPVSEHVAVFEAEHDRLQRELGTIDQV